MNAPITVQVNADAVRALKCAYETLLSMVVKEKKYLHFNNFMDESLFYASVSGSFKPANDFTSVHIWAVAIEKLTDAACKMTIQVDVPGGVSANSGSHIALISDFVQRFGQNIKSTADKT